jgi:8-oxo-dGTP pyrophosphatase MutT (NUDIX family)
MTYEFVITGCLVVKDGKFLIVQESKPGREGLYNLPSGHIDDLETVAEATVRETEEESGYTVELTGVIGVYQSIYPRERLNVSGPVFLGSVIGGEPRPSSKHPDVRWVTAKEFFDMAVSDMFWTKYPPLALRDYLEQGSYPLSLMSSNIYA